MFTSLIFGIALYVGVDYSGQYIKLAKNEFGDASPVKDKAGNVPIPAAIYVSMPNTSNTEDIITKNDVRFGTRALNMLKRKPTKGISNLPLTIGRINTSYHTSDNLTSLELNRIFARNFMRDFPVDTKYTFAVPFFWNYKMRYELRYGTSRTNSAADIISDSTAMAFLYNEKHHDRFAEEPRTVMFVDVGSTSVEAYSFLFSGNENKSRALLLAAEWSESGSGMCYADAIAKENKFSLKKGFKALTENRFKHETIANCTNVLENVIKAAQKSTLDTLGLMNRTDIKIDEVQLIGGSLKYPYITEIIKNATDFTVARDFHPLESIAIGATIRAMNINGESAAPPLSIEEKPAASYFVEYNGKGYGCCLRNSHCVRRVVANNVTADVDFLRIIADAQDTPFGANLVQHVIRMTNLSSLSIFNTTENSEADDKPNVTLNVRFAEGSDAIVRSIEACVGHNCSKVSFTYLPAIDASLEAHLALAEGIADGVDERADRDATYERLASDFGKLQEELNSVLTKKDASVRKLPTDLYNRYEQMRTWMEEGSLRKKNAETLRTIQTDVAILRRHIIAAAEAIKGRNPPPKRAAKSTKAKGAKTDL